MDKKILVEIVKVHGTKGSCIGRKMYTGRWERIYGYYNFRREQEIFSLPENAEVHNGLPEIL